MAEIIAKRYANTLFEISIEKNTLKDISKEVIYIQEIIEDNRDLLKILQSPLIKPNEKKDIFKNIFKEEISKELINFIYVVLDKNRGNYLLEIFSVFENLKDEHENTEKAEAITAVPLDDETLNNLKDSLEKSSSKNIILTNKVDSSIIGGIYIKVGDKIIDGTIRKRLNDIHDGLKEVII